MALGATIKVAMDTSAVRRGLSVIKASFSRLGSVLRGIGGAMRKSLVPVVGILAGFGVAAKRVADVGSELSDMSVQTGVGVKEIVKLQEALRLAGVPMRDTSRALSLMTANIQEARFKAGAARESIEMLGLSIPELAGQSLEDQFMTILERIRDVGDEIPNLELAMEGLFGARMGFGILRLAKDLDANMKQAAKNSESFGQFMEENADTLDKTADALGRLSMIFQQIIGRVLIALPLDKIADAINAIDAGKIADFFGNAIEAIKEFLANPGQQIAATVEFIAEAFTNFVKSQAQEIGSLIGEGVKSVFPSISKFFGGGDGPAAQANGQNFFSKLPSMILGASNQVKVEEKLTEANRLLNIIARKEGTSFA